MNKRIFSIIVLILILSLILTLSSKKELKNVEEIKVKEESNNIIGIYIKQEDNTYKQSNTIPDGYSIISSESYCIVGDNKDVKTYDMFSYDTSSKTLSVSNLTSKDTKCYLYFEKVTTKKVTTTIGEITVNLGAPTFTGAACAEGTNNSSHTSSNCEITDQNGIYEATTSEGTTYYYRGTVDNNWVKFGNYWWRII